MDEKLENQLPRLYGPLGENHGREKAQLMASLPTDAPRRSMSAWRRATRLLTGDDTMTTKRRILRLTPAAAAIVTLAIGVWLLPGPGGVESVYAELNQSAANTNAAEWVHFRGTFMGEEAEGWISVDPVRKVVKSADRIYFTDGPSLRHFFYTPANRTLRIEPFCEASRDQVANLKQKTFLEVMLAMFAYDKEREGGKLTRRAETVDGKAYDVFTFERATCAEVTSLWVDPGTKQVAMITGKGGTWPKPIRLELDYPKTGPADIYALGVPRDAKIIDNTRKADGPATRPATRPTTRGTGQSSPP